MIVAPGWYAVRGTTEVRWWDGSRFRDVTLVDGAPHYRFSWGLPAGNYVMATVVLVAFAILGLFFDSTLTSGIPMMTILCAALAVVFGVVALLAVKPLRLPRPTTAPVTTPEVQPLPGTTEPGLVAAGWYPGPAKDKPRWWTGRQWSDYLLAHGQPFPASGQAARVKRISRRIAWTCLAIVVLCAAVAVVAGVTGDESLLIVALVPCVFAAALGLGVRLGEHRAMKPFIRPMLPPSGTPVA